MTKPLGDRIDARVAGGRGRQALVFAAAGAAEATLWLNATDDRLPLCLILHASLVALLMLTLLARGDGDTTLPTLGCLLVATLGPLGALAAFALVLAVPAQCATLSPADAWFEAMSTAWSTDPPTRLAADIRAGRAYALEPMPAETRTQTANVDHRASLHRQLARLSVPGAAPTVTAPTAPAALQSPSARLALRALAARRVRDNEVRIERQLGALHIASGLRALDLADTLLGDLEALEPAAMARHAFLAEVHRAVCEQPHPDVPPVAIEEMDCRILIGQRRFAEAVPGLRQLADAGHQSAAKLLLSCLMASGDLDAFARAWDQHGSALPSGASHHA